MGGIEKGQGMQQIAELERRITAALERIGKGVEGLVSQAPAATDAPMSGAVADEGALIEIARLNDALDEERMANAQLAERLRVVRDKDARTLSDLQDQVAALTGQIDAQALEMQRSRQTVIQLRDTLRALRESSEAGLPDPGLINKAMQAELEAVTRLRAAEMAELDDILGALSPLLPAANEEPTHA